MTFLNHINIIFYKLLSFVDETTTKNVVTTSDFILPPTAPALPEETAWSMIYMEGGAMAVMLSIAVITLWRVGNKIFRESRDQNNRVFEETRKQNRDLLDIHSAALNKVSESILKVENAVKLSDVNNQHALARVTDNLSAAITRLDKHEARIEQHYDHINKLQARTHEHSSRIHILEKK